MQPASILRLGAALLVLLFAACSSEDPNRSAAPAAPSDPPSEPIATASTEPMPIPHTLNPLPGNEDIVPTLTEVTRIVMQTTAGAIVIEVYPEAAPNAAARFVELVESGFFDATPISRVVPGFVAQFGVNWRDGHRDWQNRQFDDDPTLFALERGTLAFAKAGPNTNSTQVFINYAENNRLADPQYNFTVFGKVVEGMEIVDSFVQVGDPSMGLNQGRLWSDGGSYLESLEVKPSMIETAVVR